MFIRLYACTHSVVICNINGGQALFDSGFPMWDGSRDIASAVGEVVGSAEVHEAIDLDAVDLEEEYQLEVFARWGFGCHWGSLVVIAAR